MRFRLGKSSSGKDTGTQGFSLPQPVVKGRGRSAQKEKKPIEREGDSWVRRRERAS